jgi:hypothetical protein
LINVFASLAGVRPTNVASPSHGLPKPTQVDV